MHPPLVILALSACVGEPVDSDPVVVDHGELLGVGLAPNDPFAQVGDTVSFQATTYYEDTSYEDVTSLASWLVGDDRIASYEGNGAVDALKAGVTDVVVTDASGLSARVVLTVIDESTPTSVELVPPSVSVEVGQTATVVAQATYMDGSGGNIAGSCDWSVDDEGIASVDLAGKVRGIAAGQSTVRAICPDESLSAPVEVVAIGVETGQPDLRVASMTATATSALVKYDLTVENIGTATSGSFYLDVFLDGPASGTGDTRSWIADLAPGALYDLTVEIPSPAQGSHSSYGLVDATGTVTESNESNNTAGPIGLEIGGAGPDLDVTWFDGETDGTYTVYGVEVTNAGDETAIGFWIDLFLDEATAPSLCDYGDFYGFVDELAPGDSVVFEADVDGAPTSWWDSVVFADSCGDVTESDESNNLEWVEVSY